MSSVLLAVYNDYAAAHRVRVNLVLDGFPTDRVELTSAIEPGHAGLDPAPSLHERFAHYFRMLLSGDGEQHYAEHLAARIENGAAAVTVHPRGVIEIARAEQILEHADPEQMLRHDCDHQMMEQAASPSSKPWLSNFWVEVSPDEYHCIYCRLFERSSH